jgi:hypothetical protein
MACVAMTIVARYSSTVFAGAVWCSGVLRAAARTARAPCDEEQTVGRWEHVNPIRAVPPHDNGAFHCADDNNRLCAVTQLVLPGRLDGCGNPSGPMNRTSPVPLVLAPAARLVPPLVGAHLMAQYACGQSKLIKAGWLPVRALAQLGVGSLQQAYQPCFLTDQFQIPVL